MKKTLYILMGAALVLASCKKATNKNALATTSLDMPV